MKLQLPDYVSARRRELKQRSLCQIQRPFRGPKWTFMMLMFKIVVCLEVESDRKEEVLERMHLAVDQLVIDEITVVDSSITYEPTCLDSEEALANLG